MPKCTRCEGTGLVPSYYLDHNSIGYQRNGDYKEPNYIECDTECETCNGTGEVSNDEEEDDDINTNKSTTSVG